MSMSTPISQIRSQINNAGGAGVGALPPELVPMVQSSQNGGGNPGAMMSTIYNPNVDLASPAQQSNSQLIDDILMEMNSGSVPGESHMMDTNVGNINYAMDPTANIPPPRNPNITKMMNSGGEQTRIPSIKSKHINEYYAENQAFTDESMTAMLLRELKPVVIVFVIVFILSLHQTNRLIFNLLPQLILENGELSIYAILLRAAIAAGLFYLANKYIPATF